MIPNRNTKDGISINILVKCEEQVSTVERIVSVGVIDGSSLVALCARICLFVVRFFLVVPCTVGLFHWRYK